MNNIPENTAARLILPTPKSLRTLPGKRLKFDPKVWRVLRSGDFPKEAQYLSGLFSILAEITMFRKNILYKQKLIRVTRRLRWSGPIHKYSAQT